MTSVAHDALTESQFLSRTRDGALMLSTMR
jgi:hypothetical protein